MWQRAQAEDDALLAVAKRHSSPLLGFCSIVHVLCWVFLLLGAVQSAFCQVSIFFCLKAVRCWHFPLPQASYSGKNALVTSSHRSPTWAHERQWSPSHCMTRTWKVPPLFVPSFLISDMFFAHHIATLLDLQILDFGNKILKAVLLPQLQDWASSGRHCC